MLYISPWRRLLIVGLCLATLAAAAPNLFYARVESHNDAVSALTKTGSLTEAQEISRAGWPDWAPSSLVNLGLDLRGGAHLLAEVHLSEVYKEHMDGLWPELRKALAAERATIGSIRRAPAPDGELRIQIGLPEKMEQAMDVARTVARSASLGPSGYEVTAAGDMIILQLSEAEKKATDDRTMQQSLEIVRRRVDAAGTREPTIMREGTDRILIEVPGIGSAQELKDLIGTTAKLTFQQVLRRTQDPSAQAGAGNSILPDANDRAGYYIVSDVPVVTGDNLTDARPDSDQNGLPAVSFRFDMTGAKTFGAYTAAHIGEPFAIILDGKVISAPTIQTHIAGGSGIITGQFSVEESTELALLLRAGALPAGMTFLEERTIGPELGADSIRAGMIASLVGFGAVVLYMIASYGLFGIFSSIALFLNIAMIFAVMGMIGGTLTLPGIAGIVLTIGTAVDANVLIYERIREELRAGRSAVLAMEAGFDKAMSAIIDANVTAFMSSVILFVLGAGPVRGFAVTTLIGIAASIFTAIWVVRLMISLWYAWRRPKLIVI